MKKRILLIEDDLELGNAIVEILVYSDFQVEWCKNGNDAVQYLTKRTCDLIISDLMMPSMNGEEFFLKVYKDLKLNLIPFIVITAKVDDETKFRLLKFGVNDYIVKPFKVQELLFKVTNLIDFKLNIIKKLKPDPFSKITINLSEKDFLESLNEILLKSLRYNLNHADIAKSLSISKSTLDKRMRKRTNKNVSQYIREFKIDYCLKLLDAGEKNIQFLVYETGFNSFSYFSACFKAYTGMTARDYIKNIPFKNDK